MICRTGLIIFIILMTAFSTSCLSQEYRSLVLDYDILIKDLPQNSSVIKLWIPYPKETSCQTVKDISREKRWQACLTYDRSYRNKILYYIIRNPKDSSIRIKRRYKIIRYEYSRRPANVPVSEELLKREELEKYLRPSKLVTISPRIKTLASRITKRKETTLNKAKAIYDYVFHNITYDKTVPGWGRGDTERVCIVKKGNCTDFHSLFISLSRASGIPARFIIGIPLPKEKKARFSSYHCWAEFYLEDFGWVPVDIIEAWKDKSKYEYYFGTLDENRVEFTHERDIVLEPPQSNRPLNFFINPYVEIDGEVFKDVDVSYEVKLIKE